MVCSRPLYTSFRGQAAQLPKLSVSFDGWRSGRRLVVPGAPPPLHGGHGLSGRLILSPSFRGRLAVGRTHPQKGNHGNTYWKVLDLWKNDSNVALWRYNWRRNLSYRMFRVQRKRLSTKRTVDRLMAMGRWLDSCDWFDYWYVLCCSRFRRPLTPSR
jgi:hypothetical protein